LGQVKQLRGESLVEEDERTVVDLLIEQVDFCDVILINKVDPISVEDQKRLMGILRSLNPDAHIEKKWDTNVGDALQEIVLIGMGMDEAMLQERFNSCLLTDLEMRMPQEDWKKMSNSFTEWPTSKESEVL